MSDSLSVKASPHIRTDAQWRTLMFDMEIALTPAVLMAAYRFGFGAVKVLIASGLACVLTEWVYDVCMKLDNHIGNGTAVVTGLLLGLTLPADVNLYVPIIGGIFATLVVVLLFGGYGQHFMLPALTARCFLQISFQTQMTTYAIDGVTSATPLAVLQDTGSVSLMDLFVGNVNGALVEVATIGILIGFIYLIIRRAVKLIAPVTYLVVFVLFIALFGGHGFNMNYIGAQILGGGFIFACTFFASDVVVNPRSVVGQIIYGVFLGVLTGVYRVLGTNTESVAYALICCNLLIPLIDKILPGKEKKTAQTAPAKEVA